jgi:putative transposase
VARIARIVVTDYPHHVTHRGNDRRDVFLDGVDRRVYLALARRFSERHGLRIWAYCLMTNHVHLVVVPSAPNGLALPLMQLQMSYSRWFHARHGGSGHLWGNRYYSTVVDWNRLAATIRYVELNPLRAGMAIRPERFPWSSARAHVLRQSDRLLDPDRPLPKVIMEWSAWLDRGVSTEEAERIRRVTRTGRPLGDDAFLRGLERRTGRRLAARRPGPKPRPSGRLADEGSGRQIASPRPY